MIFDRQALFSNAQAITATAPSTDQIDFTASDRIFGDAAAIQADVGKGMPIPLLIQIVESFNNLTSLEVQLQADDDVAFGSPTVVATTGAIPLASLTAGRTLNQIQIPPGTRERYFRLRYVVVGTAPTLGRVTAGVVGAIQTNAVNFA